MQMLCWLDPFWVSSDAHGGLSPLGDASVSHLTQRSSQASYSTATAAVGMNEEKKEQYTYGDAASLAPHHHFNESTSFQHRPYTDHAAQERNDKTLPSLNMLRRQELMMQLQNEIRPDILSTTPGAFDGQNNLYSVRPYNFTSALQSSTRQPTTPAGQNNDLNDSDRWHIKGLLESNKNDVGNKAVLTLNMLNMFVPAQPRMQQGALYNTRSFYIKAIMVSSNQKALPFELWQRYYQTVRPTFDKLIINIDFTVGVIIPERPLLDVFVSYSGHRDARDVLNANWDSPMFKSLRLFAKRLKFTINLPGHNTNRKQRPREIKDLVPDCDAYTFDKRGTSVVKAVNSADEIQDMLGGSLKMLPPSHSPPSIPPPQVQQPQGGEQQLSLSEGVAITQNSPPPDGGPRHPPPLISPETLLEIQARQQDIIACF
ncbi:hypothetical protein JOM56_000099 [Amanita muscaria]